jgi:hypothetical protein
LFFVLFFLFVQLVFCHFPIVGDKKYDNYGLIDVGWSNTGRVHAIIFHLRIEANKVWVEWDGIETGVAQELVDVGIPEEDSENLSM